MLTGVQSSSSEPVNFDNLRIGPTPSLPLTLGPYVAQPPLFGTRYTQDFEELGILGKGGYGIVFQCRHKLDGVIYAVKKVPVSERRRQQILIRGQPEVDDLLSELRTLAQLDHPNIVRYFNGWLDYMNLGNILNEPSESVAGAEDSRTGSFSPGRVISEGSEDHIMFENSVSLLCTLRRSIVLFARSHGGHNSDMSNRYREAQHTAQHPKPAPAVTTTLNEHPPTPPEQPSVTKMSNPSPEITAEAT